MGETTEIAWTDATFNGWIGCEKVTGAPECTFCYAESGSKRLAAQHGLKLWDGDRYVTSDGYWHKPIVWNRKAAASGKRLRVFCASFSDVFEDRVDLADPRASLFRLIEATPHLDWLLLTKRPQNMRRLAPAGWNEQWPDNVWAGTTCGSAEGIQRVRDLSSVPAIVRFVSIEPMLEDFAIPAGLGIHWKIYGGESGPHARPFDLAWFRRRLDEREDGQALFFKQAGSRPALYGLPMGLKDHKGGDLFELPEWCNVREWPKPLARGRP